MIRKEAVGRPQVVRWSSDGHAFFVDDEELFVREILPRYGFKASKMQSFQRNLNIYGFTRYPTQKIIISTYVITTMSFFRLSKGPYASGYVHSEFGRDINEEQLDWIARDSGKSKRAEGNVLFHVVSVTTRLFNRFPPLF